MSPSAPRSTPGPGRPRSETAGPAILRAAFELLAESGYRGTSMAAVALRAGVAKATVYRRWPSKAQLAVAALAEAPRLDAAPGRDLESDLVALIEQWRRIARESPLGPVLPVLLAERSRDPQLAEALAPLLVERAQPIVEAFTRAIDRGELPMDVDVELAVGLCLAPFVGGALPESSASVRDAVRIVLAGLRAGASSRGGSS